MHRLRDLLGGGCRTNGRIDRILTPLGARQRGEREHMRFIEPREWVNARHGQFVLGQRAGLIGTQHVHRCRFIDSGKSGGEDAELCQRPCAERRSESESGGQRNGDGRQNAVSASGMISTTGIFRNRRSRPSRE
jgi:hypothetical protein